MLPSLAFGAAILRGLSMMDARVAAPCHAGQPAPAGSQPSRSVASVRQRTEGVEAPTARGGGNPAVLHRRATRQDGMHRWPNAAVLMPRATYVYG